MASRIYTLGQLNQRVQFQRRSVSENELGEQDGSWQDDGPPVWAAVMPVRGAELLQAGGQQKTMDTVILVRHSSARPAASIAAAGLRVLWNGQPFDVVGAVPVDGGREWVEVQAITGMRDGRQL